MDVSVPAQQPTCFSGEAMDQTDQTLPSSVAQSHSDSRSHTILQHRQHISGCSTVLDGMTHATVAANSDQHVIANFNQDTAQTGESSSHSVLTGKLTVLEDDATVFQEIWDQFPSMDEAWPDIWDNFHDFPNPSLIMGQNLIAQSY
jgi:hypothetical protein